MGDPTYELDRPQHCVFDRGSTRKQKVYELAKCMDDLLQLIRPCSLRDTEHSMSMKGHTTEQNMTTVEGGDSAADDEETHNENRREIQTQQHSKSINLLKQNILQNRDSSGHEEQHNIFSRNILTDCVQEHLRRNQDYAFWIWLMVVRTGATDDDN